MAKWQRSFFQPVLPLGEDGRRVTGSKEHIALSRMAAGEGMVLLKNEKNALPIRRGTKVALFGKGTVDYVKGGGGSGDVTVEYIRNLYEGMKIKEDEGKVEVFDKLAKYYEKDIQKQYADGAVPGMTVEPELPDELLNEAREYTDTAVRVVREDFCKQQFLPYKCRECHGRESKESIPTCNRSDECWRYRGHEMVQRL